MEIKEDNTDENAKNSNLSLRKQKPAQKNTNEQNDLFNNQLPSNDLLPGEIILKNEEIVFTHKKRQRENNKSILNLPKDNSSLNIINENDNEEEKAASKKALDIFKELQIPPSPGIKEGEYDSQLHDKKEKIVLDILKDEDLINNQRKLATSTKNIDIYCAILDNFNTFCYYNNKFMVNSHYCLDKIVDNAFTFQDKSKSIPLALKFCNSIFDFGFFDEYNKKFIEYFIGILLNENKMNDINNIPRSKIYLYYIIYLIFKDSWDNIVLENDIIKKFMNKILSALNIYDYELTEIIIQLINTVCDNILYPKIFKNQEIDILIASEVNKYMFKLITETIKNLSPDKKDEILKNESTNFIIKQSFNIIIKIISGINLIKENDLGVQETLVSQENKKFYYEFILFFSNFELTGKNFTWFLDILAKFAEISYYSDIYLKEDVINIIFQKFTIKFNYICEVFQFMRSLLEGEQLFKCYSACQQFYDALNTLDVGKNPYLTTVHYMFIIEMLLSNGEKLGVLDSIYDRLCVIQAKEKVEEIFYKYGNEEIIHKKYNEIMPKLDELNKKSMTD